MTALTPRELTYLRLRASGLHQREVASAMGISVHTVKAYQSQISEKVVGYNGTLWEVLHALGWIRIPEGDAP